MSKKIPFALPILNHKEILAVKKVLQSKWITTGEVTKQFENDFSNYIGSPFSLAVNSATSGLHLALKAIGVQKGDYVITSIYTFSATAAAIEYTGATPIFCDIESLTKNINTLEIEKICQYYSKQYPNKLKAIIPVHFAGQSCTMDKIMEIAQKYKLKVIEDAAHALPTTYKNQKIGTIGDITVFSFYATKPLATAEGGMVTTKHSKLFDIMKNMRLHGIDREAWERNDKIEEEKTSWSYDILTCGFKYNLPDILSAIGIEQLKKIDKFYQNRKLYADFYNKHFQDIKEIKTPFIQNSEDIHSYHLYCISVPKTIRNTIIAKLLHLYNIQCSVHFIPLCKMKYWKEKYTLQIDDFPNAMEAFYSTISLPIYSIMPQKTLHKIATCLKIVLQNCL